MLEKLVQPPRTPRENIAILICLILMFGVCQRPAQAAFDAHGGPVKSVAVSVDGSLALTASFDYSIILWDLAEERVRVELEGHDAAVNAVTFVPGDRQALSASDDGTVVLWDLDDGAMLRRFEGHDGKVVAVAVSPDGRIAASAGWDRTIRLWDLVDHGSIAALSWRDNLNAVGFSADGQSVIAGAADGELTVWRVADGMRLAAIDGHEFAITGLDQHAADGIIATSSIDETVRLWDLEQAGDEGSNEPIATLYGHDGPVLSVDLSADGELVASGGVDGTVRVWRRGDGDRLKVFARHHGPVWSVTFAPDGETLLSGGADGLVLTYDLDAADGPEAGDLAERGPAVAAGTASRGEKLFKTCSACHTTTPDDGHRAGPTLHDLFGRRAGSHPDYRYSPALEQSDLVWNEETIDQLFSIGPDQLLPGTKMPLQRMPNDQDRADLIAFLKRVTSP
ncbi:MAG: c-type cytochrome [Alphaproteobacteria bacterium]|nr:c-type cytochrome [Alphaproteobacteria bacterium]